MTQAKAALAALGGMVLLLWPAVAFAEKPNTAGPNIVLCMADDQGWGDTGYNGHPLIQTPNLDKMAAAGLRFDRFHAAAPVCSPTRASVMTGRHPNRMGAFSWGHTLRPREITVAEALKRAGYATGHFGKWHLGSVRVGCPVNPGNSGFDHWLSAPNFYDNDPILSREGKAVELEGESSMVAADAAIEFITRQVAAGKPFLAVVWFGSPHRPHSALPQDKAPYDGHKDADWMGEITGLDRAVGKLRQALRELGVHENTLFWYTSDNGGLRNESTGGRARKGSIYEGGLRVPAIIEWPERIDRPRTTNMPACTSDIYPTLLDIVGVEIADQPPLDGVSLLPLIDGRVQQHPPIGFWGYPVRGMLAPSKKWMAKLLEAQKQGDIDGNDERIRREAGEIEPRPLDDRRGHAAWLDWPWKLHRIQRKNKVKYELYNLADDPMERNDLSDQRPSRAKTMRAALEQWQSSVMQSYNGEDY